MEIKMNKMINKILIWLIFFSQFICIPAALAYKKDVHVTITKNAVLNSQNIKSGLEAAGLLSSNGNIENKTLKGQSISARMTTVYGKLRNTSLI
jgi:hypothetical protein